MTTSTRSYGGKSPAQRAAERRVRLVDATVEVFAEHGEAHVTMTRVCQAAGLTERYFYESFTHLDDALLAALDAVCAEMMDLTVRAVRAVGDAEQTPDVRVHAVMRAFVDFVEQHPAKAKVAVVHSGGNPRLRARRHELVSVFADLVAREAADLYGDRAWPLARGRVHGLVYIAGFAELLGAWLTGAVAMTADELVETAEDLFPALAQRR